MGGGVGWGVANFIGSSAPFRGAGIHGSLSLVTWHDKQQSGSVELHSMFF